MIRRLVKTLIYAGFAVMFADGMAFAADGKSDAHQNPSLIKGIELYKAGNYRACIGQFGAALDTEYDNATLHYYMANALINIKQRETAIKEFRIAYALAPKQQPGILSKLALSYMGADNYDDGVHKPDPKKEQETKKEPPVDPVFEKTLQMLRKQADDAAIEGKFLTPAEAEFNRLLDEHIKKSKAQVVDAILKANPDDIKLNQEALDHLGRVKKLNDEKMRRAGHVVKKTGDIKDTADSLQSLLKEKNPRSAPRLVPHGTNLYIRNYNSQKEPQKNQKPN